MPRTPTTDPRSDLGDAALSEDEALRERWVRASSSLSDARSLADVIMATLSEAIVERELPSDWPLREERLAGLFGVSRTPIREALARLANSGLARRDERGSLRVGSITPEQILDVYAVRKCLEGLSASLAAETATPRAVAHLEHIQRACRQAYEEGDFEGFAAANSDFHLGMAQTSGNEFLIRFLAEVEQWVKRFPNTTLSSPGRPETALEEHDEIIAAIAARDSARAEQLACQHMASAEKLRMQMLFDQMPSRQDLR